MKSQEKKKGVPLLKRVFAVSVPAMLITALVAGFLLFWLVQSLEKTQSLVAPAEYQAPAFAYINRAGGLDLAILTGPDVILKPLVVRTETAEPNYWPMMPSVSPDGSRVAFTAGYSRADDNLYVCDVRVVEISTLELETFTHGSQTGQCDTRIAWSHDGTKLGFVRAAFSGQDFEVYQLDMADASLQLVDSSTLSGRGGERPKLVWSEDRFWLTWPEFMTAVINMEPFGQAETLYVNPSDSELPEACQTVDRPSGLLAVSLHDYPELSWEYCSSNRLGQPSWHDGFIVVPEYTFEVTVNEAESSSSATEVINHLIFLETGTEPVAVIQGDQISSQISWRR